MEVLGRWCDPSMTTTTAFTPLSYDDNPFTSVLAYDALVGTHMWKSWVQDLKGALLLESSIPKGMGLPCQEERSEAGSMVKYQSGDTPCVFLEHSSQGSGFRLRRHLSGCFWVVGTKCPQYVDFRVCGRGKNMLYNPDSVFWCCDQGPISRPWILPLVLWLF